MIKIIKSGKKEFHAICPFCGCEFTYEQEDLNGTSFINCPECNAITAIDNMQSNNPCAKWSKITKSHTKGVRK